MGEIFTKNENLKDHITEIKGKAEAAYQTMLTIAGNIFFNNIQMKTIITYGGETRNPTIKENKDINNILDNIIKGVLMAPVSTSREVLYIETGILDAEHISIRNRINMEKRLNMNPDGITKKMEEDGAKFGWKHQTQKAMNKFHITPEDLHGTREQAKRTIKSKITLGFIENIEASSGSESKLRYLLDN